MRKKFYPPKRPDKKSGHKTGPKPMKPGSDRSLRKVFEKIGVPEKTGFKPDPFQIQAIDAIMKSDCLVTAPTGSGKTWIAEQVEEN